ncbi:hypothetical protein H6P81_011456 [Aristolochia fimbriata]|uniref:F-box domain-containing protein n=1 Tax=Aristolochia fimbriata TaxID=158543 RepID=A0AAV7ESN7_ARIFI|nr:hypothetical protein H6P81_011456 [Aristolochia fimbriata]
MEALPDEVLTEILGRLWKKPSCRCKCVSKRWRDLISGSGGDKPKVPNSGCLIQKENISPTDEVYDASNFSLRFFRFDEKGKMTAEESLDLNKWVFPSMLGTCDGLLFYCLKTGKKVQFWVSDPVTKGIRSSPSVFPISDQVADRLRLGVGFRNRSLEIKKGKNRAAVAVFDFETGEWSRRRRPVFR